MEKKQELSNRQLNDVNGGFSPVEGSHSIPGQPDSLHPDNTPSASVDESRDVRKVKPAPLEK